MVDLSFKKRNLSLLAGINPMLVMAVLFLADALQYVANKTKPSQEISATLPFLGIKGVGRGEPLLPFSFWGLILESYIGKCNSQLHFPGKGEAVHGFLSVTASKVKLFHVTG